MLYRDRLVREDSLDYNDLKYLEALKDIVDRDLYSKIMLVSTVLPANVVKNLSNFRPKTPNESLAVSFLDDEIVKYLVPAVAADGLKENVRSGKLTAEDLIFKRPTNAMYRDWSRVVIKIVRQFVGSGVTHSTLTDAAWDGVYNAIKKYDPSSPNAIHFKTYMAYMVRFSIQNAIKHELSIPDSVPNVLMVDDVTAKEMETGMGKSDDPVPNDRELSMWKRLDDWLKKTLPKNKYEMFAKYFGLFGFTRKGTNEIASEYGVSRSAIRNVVINPVLRKMNQDAAIRDLLNDLRDVYVEGYMCDAIHHIVTNDTCCKNTIKEDFIYAQLTAYIDEAKNVLNVWKEVYDGLTDDERWDINATMTCTREELDDIWDDVKGTVCKVLAALEATEPFGGSDADVMVEWMRVRDMVNCG